MKKRVFLSLAALVFCATAPLAVYAQQGKKAAVVYYSLSGSTDKVARKIADVTGAVLIRIETSEPYDTKDMNKLRDYVKNQQNTKKWPALKPISINLANFDTVFLGSPVWFAGIACPMVTFLNQTDFKGKKVVTFGTKGGGEGNFFSDFKKYVKNGTVENGIVFTGSDKDLDKKVTDWVKKVKL
ncbi:MAG: hypothetical protein LBG72_04030 [Spirochaetaceae bacterium]|jgi:flavodoxin|nr:hypothetical protein [Spirochaetaceae bacterium]